MSTFTHDLCLKPGVSKYFASLLALCYGGALGLLIPLTLPLFIKLAFSFFLIGSAVITAYRHLDPTNHPLYGSFVDKNTLKLVSQQDALISPDSYSFPQLVVLRAVTKNPCQTHTLVIFPDALDQTTFRRLRVRLRHPFS